MTEVCQGIYGSDVFHMQNVAGPCGRDTVNGKGSVALY